MAYREHEASKWREAFNQSRKLRKYREVLQTLDYVPRCLPRYVDTTTWGHYGMGTGGGAVQDNGVSENQKRRGKESKCARERGWGKRIN